MELGKITWKYIKNLKRLERHLNTNTGRVLNCKFKIKKYLNEIGEYKYEILYNNENYIANLDFMNLVFSVSLKILTMQQVFEFMYLLWLFERGELGWSLDFFNYYIL